MTELRCPRDELCERLRARAEKAEKERDEVRRMLCTKKGGSSVLRIKELEKLVRELAEELECDSINFGKIALWATEGNLDKVIAIARPAGQHVHDLLKIRGGIIEEVENEPK